MGRLVQAEMVAVVEEQGLLVLMGQQVTPQEGQLLAVSPLSKVPLRATLWVDEVVEAVTTTLPVSMLNTAAAAVLEEITTIVVGQVRTAARLYTAVEAVEQDCVTAVLQMAVMAVHGVRIPLVGAEPEEQAPAMARLEPPGNLVLVMAVVAVSRTEQVEEMVVCLAAEAEVRVD